MIGVGRYRYLQPVQAGLYAVRAAIRLSQRLHRITGCQLFWHRGRRVYVVMRFRGAMTPPQSYCDLGLEHLPLTQGVLITLVEMIHYTDAKSSADHERMMDAYLRYDEQRQEDENRRFIDERFPDFCADMRRMREILGDGRRRQKYHDLGGGVSPN